MATEKRFIDANALVAIMREEDKLKPGVPWSTTAVARYIEMLSTVDAAEVVRCRDCKHYVDSPYDNEDMMCDNWERCIFPNDDDFCSCGERKTNDD